MAEYRKLEARRVFCGKLKHGGDLLTELEAFCVQENIKFGWIHAIGAVSKARIGFYDQQTKIYKFLEIDRNLEIANLAGNVSIKDGRQMVHAHVALSDEEGKSYGGHLAQGTIVFACEFVITEYEGADFVREHDQTTGLGLWKM